MLRRGFRHTFLALFTALYAMSWSYAYGEEQPQTKAVAEAVIETQAEEITVNTTLIAEIDTTVTVTLDGETLKSTEVHRSDKGGLYVNAMPIFQSLNNEVEFDPDTKALIVRRSQDGVVMELYTDTGIVKADGKALGKLKHFGEVRQGRYILTPNAIAVLSGAAGKYNEDTRTFDFKLDPRLKVATGFEIFVNDVALGNLDPAPKSVGPVLILPLLPIADALGHDVRILEGGEEVKIRRAQDSAEFTLNLQTGLIKLRGKPYGITKDIAYIDETNLLLPVSAIEALTGTHVTVEGGSNRISIDLDERLTGAIKPGVSVDEDSKNTPFTPETLSFHLGPDSINRVDAEFRQGRINGRVRFEMPDLPTNEKELEPSWLSLDFAHTKGVTGSIGDYSADRRELDGVGLRRIRGVAAVKTTDNGRWSLAAGAPATGAKQISSDQSRLTFDGFAAGARYASKDGWEAGASLKTDSLTDDQMAVLSAISGRLGREKDKKFQWDARADAGVFNGPARAKNVDVRLGLNARYDINDTVTLDAFTQYDGSEFLRSRLDTEQREDDITDALNPDGELEEEDVVPDTRERGIDQLSVGGSLRLTPNKDFGVFKNPAASVRVQNNISGFAVGREQGATSQSYGASVASAIGETGVSLSLDATKYNLSYADERESEDGRQFSARVYKRFEAATVRAQYTNSRRGDNAVRQSLSGAVTARNFNLPLPKDADLSAAPSVSALWNGEDTTVRGGIIANFNSGALLGEKTRLDASLGVLQSFSGNQGNQSDQFFTVSLARKVRIGNNMALGLAYRNDLQGNQRVGLQLDGRFDFNDKRKYKQTKEGRGVLKGRAFLDKNRDQVKQEDEPAIPNALVRVKGTRLALRTDRGGYFTIQNIKQGLYEIQIDGRSLPLGFALSDDISTRVTISEAHITDIPLPIVQRGQIRGFAFIDENEDGEFTQGEERYEGAKLLITPRSDEDKPSYTTSFGQFAFDDLAAGKYEIRVVSNEKTGISGFEPVIVDLGSYDNLLAKIKIPMRRRSPVQLAHKEPDSPARDIQQDTMALAPKGSAPP